MPGKFRAGESIDGIGEGSRRARVSRVENRKILRQTKCLLRRRRPATSSGCFPPGSGRDYAALLEGLAAVTHATVRVNWPGMRQDDILARIELLGREVLVLSPAALAGYSVLRVHPAVVA